MKVAMRCDNDEIDADKGEKEEMTIYMCTDGSSTSMNLCICVCSYDDVCL